MPFSETARRFRQTSFVNELESPVFRDFESEFRQVLPGFDTPLFSSSESSLPDFDPVLDLPQTLESEEALLETSKRFPGQPWPINWHRCGQNDRAFNFIMVYFER